MENPYTTISHKDYELTIFHGIDPLDPDDDSVDVKVTFPNGESFSAVFFTPPNINSLMKRYKKTGECAGGLYFWVSDMIIVEKLTEEVICETIDNLLAEEEFKYVFSKNEKLEDVSPAEGDKLFKCFDEYLNEP